MLDYRTARSVSGNGYGAILCILANGQRCENAVALGSRNGRRSIIAYGTYSDVSRRMESWLHDRQLAASRLGALRSLSQGYAIIGRTPSGRSRYLKREVA